jgi:hypothetical protein
MTLEFDIERYCDLLRAIRAGGYRFAFFDKPPAAGDLLMRHDVDLSLRAALAMAEVEAEADVQSTWFLMTRSAIASATMPCTRSSTSTTASTASSRGTTPNLRSWASRPQAR